MAELLSEKLRKQIDDSGFGDDLSQGFMATIKNMSDQDLREYIWNNRAYFRKMMPDVIKEVPDFQEYINNRPNFGNQKVDLAKAFNDPDIMNKLNQLTPEEIDYVARKNGMNYQDFVKQMWNQKLDYDRNNIAHGGSIKDIADPEKYISFWNNPIADNIGGAALSLFGKRQQEAIARGEDPGLKDYAGDIGEQALYLAPWGRGMQALGAAGKLAKAGQVASNAVAPVLTEAYDAAVYDDDNPRGEFNTGDVIMGTTINAAAPYGLNKIVRGGERLLSQGAKQAGEEGASQVLRELGVGKSAEQVAKDASKSYTNQSYAQGARTRASHGYPLTDRQLAAAQKFSPENKAKIYALRDRLKKGDLKLDDSDIELINSDQELKDLYHLKTGQLRSEADLVGEEAAKNWVTNTFGDKTYSDGSVALPIVGNRLNKVLEEERALEASKKAEEESKERIRELYGLYW